MATIEKYLLGTNASLLTTELNSLANNSLAVASAAYNNTVGGGGGDGYTLGEFELVFTFGVAPTANTGLSVWLLGVPDGTNYEDGSSSITPARLADLVFPVRAVTTAQRVVVRATIPPGNWKALVKNDGTGQALAASANTLKLRPYTPQGV